MLISKLFQELISIYKCVVKHTPNSPVLRIPRPRAVHLGEAKMRTASWENVNKQMPRNMK